jgi:hypothetical protein
MSNKHKILTFLSSYSYCLNSSNTSLWSMINVKWIHKNYNVICLQVIIVSKKHVTPDTAGIVLKDQHMINFNGFAWLRVGVDAKVQCLTMWNPSFIKWCWCYWYEDLICLFIWKRLQMSEYARDTTYQNWADIVLRPVK